MTSISIPSNVSDIGENAFAGCTGLTSISVDSNNKIYDSRDNCNAIIITESNTLYVGCKNTFIPDGVTVISYRAFAFCTELTSVTIPDSVTGIGASAFKGCTGLISVKIGKNVMGIGASAFKDCTGLTSITIPDSVTSIDNYAFSGCTGLTSITIPESVTNIGSNAFEACKNLKEVYYLGSPTQWDSIEFSSGNDFLTNASIKFGCENCGDNAAWSFDEESGCLTISGTGAIYDNYSGWDSIKDEIKSIKIGKGITAVGKNAFYDCNNLSAVCIESDSAMINDSSFPKKDSLQFITAKGSDTLNNLTQLNYNVIPYSLTEKTYKKKQAISFDGKITITAELWSCIYQVISNSDAYYIYFEEVEFKDILPEEIIEGYEDDELTFKEVYFAISRDGKDIKLNTITEKQSFIVIIENAIKEFSFTVSKALSSIMSYVAKWLHKK